MCKQNTLMKTLYKTISFILITLIFGCSSQSQTNVGSGKVDFSYWLDGKAEVAVYSLKQNRYNDIHDGEVVNVFVAEDFLEDKQVKNETYTSKNSIKILKNIRTTKFNTGIYDYSIHTSSFTPIDRSKYEQSLKIACSMQEWCGTKYLQLNRRNSKFNIKSFSYFEKEGDETFTINLATQEDELQNIVRLNPKLLPLGEIQIVPSFAYLQLMHKKVKAYAATATNKGYKRNDFEGENLNVYSLQIKDLQKTLQIYYEANAPYKIVGWKESYPSAFDGKIRTTVVTLKSVQRLAYWGLNSKSDSTKRVELGLD